MINRYYLLISIAIFLFVSCSAQIDIVTSTSSADALSPSAVNTNPTGSAQVARNINEISVRANEGLSEASSSVTLVCDGQTINTGAVEYDAEDFILSADVTETLPASASCTATWTITDSAGNQTTVTVTFTTTADSDTTQPTVASSTPSNNSTGVSTTLGEMVFNFSEAMDATACTASNLSCAPSISFSSCTYSSSNNRCTCTVSANLSASTSYTCTLSNQTDAAGNSLQGNSISFTTGAGADTTAPTVVQISPPNGATVVSILEPVCVCFSETIGADQCTPSKATISPANTSGAGDGTFGSCCVIGATGCTKSIFCTTATCANTEFQFSLPDAVTWEVKATVPIYTITIQNVQDPSGNTMSSSSVSWEPQE